MEAARTPAPVALPRERGGSAHLLRPSSDEALVQRARTGSEAAFTFIYKRHHRGILSFCRHMLGSAEEAEDAVQQTFISAYSDLARNDKDINLRPWLYRIARNQCISMLRRRRQTVELSDEEPSLEGLSSKVASRSDLRSLLGDLAKLPLEQREALLLSELHDNSHAEVAEVIGCDKEKVKSLVFQARSSLLKSREARDLSCVDIQQELSTLRGSARRRGALGRHVRECSACRIFGADLKRQRKELAVVLAVVPSATLKLGAANAMAAAGLKTGKVAASALLLKGAATTASVVVLASGAAVGVERVKDAVGAPAAPAAQRGAPADNRSDHPGSRRGLGPAPAAADGLNRARTRGRGRKLGLGAIGPLDETFPGAPGAPHGLPGNRGSAGEGAAGNGAGGKGTADNRPADRRPADRTPTRERPAQRERPEPAPRKPSESPRQGTPQRPTSPPAAAPEHPAPPTKPAKPTLPEQAVAPSTKDLVP